jgi:hypothetical protein
LSIPSKKKIILYVGGKAVLDVDENISLFSKYPEATQDCKTLGYIEVSYKAVVFCQQASGIWNNELIKLLKGVSTIQELTQIQTNEEIKKMKPETILTLVGIKLLKTYFKDNMKEWRFVYAKGVQQLKVALGSSASIDAVCDALILDIAF